MATPIYSDIPQGGLTSLNTGDKLVFNDKLNFQNPDVQSLFNQGVAIPTYGPNQNVTGVELIKPYIAPGTTYVPPANVSDLMRNYLTGNQINLQTQAPKTATDWASQGYGQMNTSTVNGGTLNTQNIGGGQQYQEFIQRPAGYGATTQTADAGDNIGSMAIRDLQNPTDAYGRPINGTVYQAPVLSEAEQRQKLLEEQQKALEAESQAQQAEVKQEFRASRTNTVDAGNRMAGTLQRILGRAGAFTTSSGGQAVIAQATSLQNQLTKLDQAESAALQKVRAAVMTQNANNAAKAWEDIYKIKQDQQDALAKQAELLQDALDRQDALTQQNFENEQAVNAAAFEKLQYEEGKSSDFAQAKTAQDLKLLSDGYKYVNTPAERDTLKAQGYDIVSVGGRTYAKPPEPVKVKGTPGPKISTPEQAKTNWTQKTVDSSGLYNKYITGGYNPVEAAQRIKELTGYMPKDGEWAIARQFVLDNANADPKELKSVLLEKTNLTVSEINSLLPE